MGKNMGSGQRMLDPKPYSGKGCISIGSLVYLDVGMKASLPCSKTIDPKEPQDVHLTRSDETKSESPLVTRAAAANGAVER